MQEIPAGRELDALVAEKVMGWKLTCPVDPTCGWNMGPKGWSYNRNLGINPETGEEERFPFFSTSIAAAWQVVEKMRKGGWLWLRLTTCDTTTIATFLKDGTFTEAQAQNIEPATAICLAALKAMEGSHA